MLLLLLFFDIIYIRVEMHYSNCPSYFTTELGSQLDFPALQSQQAIPMLPNVYVWLLGYFVAALVHSTHAHAYTLPSFTS